MNNITTEICAKLFKPVDASSLVVFRIGFGLIMMWEVWRYWHYGWIESKYIDPDFFFKYYGFEWVHPWSGDLMYWHYGITALLAFFITIGFLYRISACLYLYSIQLYISSRSGAVSEPYLPGTTGCIIIMLLAG
jgi:vitamin K-dependent gamma-carboxylase